MFKHNIIEIVNDGEMTFGSLQSYFSVLNYHNSNEPSASTHTCMDIALYSKEQYDARYNIFTVEEINLMCVCNRKSE